MPLADARCRTLFLPVVRGNYDRSMTVAFAEKLRTCAQSLGIDAIFPDPSDSDGLVQTDADLRRYWQKVKGDLADIKGLVALSADFMQERRIMDMVRLLPEDVAVFLIVANDDPRRMVDGEFGDALCGSLSVHHNVRLLGREMCRCYRLDPTDEAAIAEALSGCKRLIDGAEALRGMRIAMLGVNPDSFATTFANLPLLFQHGFSLHTYELMDMFGDVVLGAQLGDGDTHYEGDIGTIRLNRPVRRDDPRLESALQAILQAGIDLRLDEAAAYTLARMYVWVQELFTRDRIDAGTIHCWPEFQRYFGQRPCTLAMLANTELGKPIVCELDVCHAIMAKLAWELTGEAGVILDVNNNGWDDRIFNVFHCSQTAPTWLRAEDASVLADGTIEGRMAPEPFTAISAATSADTFHATVFQGRFLEEDAGLRGSSGWAFVPNLPEVMSRIEATGIHHFVAMKGHLGADVADILRFKGLTVADLSREVRETSDLPPMPA